MIGRTPRWVRGLKFSIAGIADLKPLSHPTMGAWIEIMLQNGQSFGFDVAPHDGCVD